MSPSPRFSPLPGEDALPEEMARALDAARHRMGPLGLRVHYFPSVGSTNDVAASIAAGPDAEGAVVIADRQTSGRGRLGRTWFSPPGSGLYVSVVLTTTRARIDPGRAALLLTLTAGVALAEAVEAVTGVRPDMKWPNDLYVGRRKLGGILAEAIAGTPAAHPAAMNIVLGYGINTAPAAYPPELGDRATSLESELGRPVDRVRLLVESLGALARRHADLLDGAYDAILDAWRVRAPSSIGTRVTWTTSSGSRSGITAGVDDNGALLVQAGERIERIAAGEVTWF